MVKINESQRKCNGSSKQSSNQSQIIDFLDIDVNRITFEIPKPNKYNGSQIAILYNGKTMFVKYDGLTPFGLKENFDKDGAYLGTSMQINCEDRYLEKAKELDQFFINVFYEKKWGLSKHVPIENIIGYDIHGQGGLWKRICKDPYKVNKDTGEREYLNYPSKMEFTLLYRNDKLQTTMFDWDGQKLPNDSDIQARSRVKFVAAWFSLTRGTFGLTLKPKLMQVMFKEAEDQFNSCLLMGDCDEQAQQAQNQYEKPICLNPDLGYDENDDEAGRQAIQQATLV